jgi:leucyl-tRNA synthetase
LATKPEFYQADCPGCGKQGRRETDVSDTFLDSVWYYLRYPSLGNGKEAWDKGLTKKWLPVNMYIGGAEHAVLHLFYSRFVAMALKDMGLIDFEEPFTRFYAHGLLIKEGAKMSKSKGNIVVPDSYIAKYGADTFRTYLMFLGPFTDGGDFKDTGIAGMRRFIDRVWNLVSGYSDVLISDEKELKEITFKMHQTIKKVTEDVRDLKYNTAISAIMEYVNFLRAKTEGKIARAGKERCREWDQAIGTLVLLLAPFTPHLAEEAWVNILGEDFSVHNAAWPEFKEELAREEKILVIVQVNAKLRGQLVLSEAESRDEAKVRELASNDTKISSWLDKGKVKKVIFVPEKLINFVVS